MPDDEFPMSRCLAAIGINYSTFVISLCPPD